MLMSHASGAPFRAEDAGDEVRALGRGHAKANALVVDRGARGREKPGGWRRLDEIALLGRGVEVVELSARRHAAQSGNARGKVRSRTAQPRTADRGAPQEPTARPRDRPRPRRRARRAPRRAPRRASRRPRRRDEPRPSPCRLRDPSARRTRRPRRSAAPARCRATTRGLRPERPDARVPSAAPCRRSHMPPLAARRPQDARRAPRRASGAYPTLRRRASRAACRDAAQPARRSSSRSREACRTRPLPRRSSRARPSRR